jgi:hypothetical protein
MTTSFCHPETLVAIEAQASTSTTPLTTSAIPTKQVERRRRLWKPRNNRSRHITTRRSIDWRLVNGDFDTLHARFDFTLEECADDEGLNFYKHCELPH